MPQPEAPAAKTSYSYNSRDLPLIAHDSPSRSYERISATMRDAERSPALRSSAARGASFRNRVSTSHFHTVAVLLRACGLLGSSAVPLPFIVGHQWSLERWPTRTAP